MRLVMLAAVLALVGCAPRASVDAASLRAALTPDRVAALQVPMIFVTLPDLEVAATLVQVGRSDDVITWRSRDGVQLSFKGRVLTATRGLGYDLMSADVPDVVHNPGTFPRVMSFLDGDYETIFKSWRCTVSKAGSGTHDTRSKSITVRIVHETCRGLDGSIQNQYHVDMGGVIWWSRQWVSPQVGYVLTERIKRSP